MAHLELAHLFASNRSKASTAIAAGATVETGQETVIQSPSFSQWLRTSILGDPAADKTNSELGNPPASEAPLDSLAEIANARTPQDPSQAADPASSDDLIPGDSQAAIPTLVAPDDSGTDAQPANSILDFEKQTPTSDLEELAGAPMPDLGTKKEVLPIDGSTPEKSQGLAAGKKINHPETPDDKHAIEMPWAGFSLFMESRAALQSTGFSREDSPLIPNTANPDDVSESVGTLSELTTVDSSTAVSPEKAGADGQKASPVLTALSNGMQESIKLPSKVAETTPAAANSDRGAATIETATDHPAVSSPWLAPIDGLAQRRRSHQASGVVPISTATERSSDALTNSERLGLSKQGPALELPATPVNKITSAVPAAPITSTAPAIPVVPAVSAKPAGISAITTNPAIPAIQSSSITPVMPITPSATLAIPVISTTPAVTATPTPNGVPALPAMPSVSTTTLPVIPA
ncbi:MAG TPA: hypothetical protein PK820_15420, partial [Candidatus Competibacteraceae bacterium]|nr:hypothetical protein [Candidatus Competibacteraceae bacterium]